MARQTITQMAESLTKKCHFDKTEIECLLQHYKCACEEQKKKMDRTRFRMVLHNNFNITDDIIMDRVFRAFDKDNDSLISQEEWVKGMSVFLRGTSEEKVKFCFDVYDMNGDSFITREEMFHLLKPSVVKISTDEDPDEGIKELVEIVVKKMDQDGDNRLCLEDYRIAVEKEPLLLEVFGSCLPDGKCVDAFMAYLMGDTDGQGSLNYDDNQQRERKM